MTTIKYTFSWTVLVVVLTLRCSKGSVVRLLDHDLLTPGENVNGLTYIGTATQKGLLSSSGLQPSLYFTNNVPDTWEGGNAACNLVLGPDATLLSIETANEVKVIRDMLETNRNPMETFWTVGEYNSGRGEFLWAKGKPVEDEQNATVWDVGHPNQEFDSTKLLMVKRGGEWYVQNRDKGEKHPYICEFRLGSAMEPVPCYHTNDLIIAVDSSGSVPEADFLGAMQKFVKPLVEAWKVSEGSRIGLSIFSSGFSKIFDFGTSVNLTTEELLKKIDDTRYISGGTNTHLALDHAFQDFKLYYRAISRNLVLITDGGSNNPTLTIHHADNLHRAGVRCFSIGMGRGINARELLAIAENATQVFYEHTYGDIHKLLKPVSELVCYDHLG